VTARAALAAVLLALAAPTAARADDATRTITLADALAEARAHNPSYRAAIAARDGAAAQARGAAGVDDRLLEAGVDGLTRAADPVTGPFFQETGVDAIGGHVALWQPLPWGGRVGVEVAEQVARTSVRVAAGGPVSDITTTVHQPRAELVWQQPLLRDRGRRGHAAAPARASAAADAAEASRAAAEVALAYDVERAYWELAYAEREVQIRDSALALARDQERVIAARAEVGKVAELEVATAAQAIAAREAARLAAEQDRAARARSRCGCSWATSTRAARGWSRPTRWRPRSPRRAPRTRWPARWRSRRGCARSITRAAPQRSTWRPPPPTPDRGSI
jgi:hypothetical protein